MQLIQATERRTNVTCRWNAVEILRSAHTIFPSGTTQIRTARHQRATYNVIQLAGSLLTPRQHSLSLTRLTEWEVFGSSERFSYDTKRVQGKDQTRLSGSFSVGEGDLRTRAVQPPLAQPGTSDSLSLSLSLSPEILRNCIAVPSHPRSPRTEKKSAGR